MAVFHITILPYFIATVVIRDNFSDKIGPVQTYCRTRKLWAKIFPHAHYMETDFLPIWLTFCMENQETIFLILVEL